MTEEQVNQILMEMERLRMDSYEAGSDREVARLDREYGRLWATVKPYVSRRVPYSKK